MTSTVPRYPHAPTDGVGETAINNPMSSCAMLKYCMTAPNGERNMFCAQAYQTCLRNGGAFYGLPYTQGVPWTSEEFTPYPELFGYGAMKGLQ